MEKDAYYFPHFSNARHDRKLKRIKKDLGIEGYGIYFMLLEVLREQREFKYPYADLDLLADDFGTSLAKIETIVNVYDLFNFDKESNFFSPKLIFYLTPYLNMLSQRRLAGMRSGEARRKKYEKEKLNGCSTDVQRMFNGSSTDVQRMFNGSSTDVQRMFNGSSTDVQRMFNGSSTDAERMLEQPLNEIEQRKGNEMKGNEMKGNEMKGNEIKSSSSSFTRIPAHAGEKNKKKLAERIIKVAKTEIYPEKRAIFINRIITKLVENDMSAELNMGMNHQEIIDCLRYIDTDCVDMAISKMGGCKFNKELYFAKALISSISEKGIDDIFDEE